MAALTQFQSRSSGILLHVTSLPGPYGIGDLGPVARQWIDLLADAKQAWWQILPLVTTGSEHSPYESYSAFAGNPMLISPDDLVADGFLLQRELPAPLRSSSKVDYARARRIKALLLNRAADRFFTGRKSREAYDRYCVDHAGWLDDYALFSALRQAHDQRHWTDWPPELVCREPSALRAARDALAEPIRREKFVQFVFDRQLRRLRAHAKRRKVGLIGDLPIFVSYEACDVWANPQLFQLDRHRRPTAVAGVPPDLFSASGQRWGNPLYNFDAMAADGFTWWMNRLRRTLQQCDWVRLDHFRGFEAYWRIPASCPDARRGKWTQAPGREMLAIFQGELGPLPIIAEDLGVITPPVEKLRDDFGLPGMRVLQFGFGGSADNPHLPHNYVRNCVTYSGTHDNDTTRSWFRSLDSAGRKSLKDYLGKSTTSDNVSMDLIRLAWSSIAKVAIAPLQDVLGLSGAARMNTPGTHRGNWRWRLDRLSAVDDPLSELARLTRQYGRG